MGKELLNTFFSVLPCNNFELVLGFAAGLFFFFFLNKLLIYSRPREDPCVVTNVAFCVLDLQITSNIPDVWAAGGEEHPRARVWYKKNQK